MVQRPTIMRRRTLLLLSLLPIMLLLLGCGIAGSAMNGTPSAMDVMSDNVPRWICPSATPLPTIRVEDGTKPNDLGTPETAYRDTEPYEREYGQRPPPRPTAYSKGAGFQSVTAFFIGQIVNWRSVDVKLDAIQTQGSGLEPDEGMYVVRLTWHNNGQPFVFDPARQVAITAIGRTDGRQTAGRWQVSARAAQAAGVAPDTLTAQPIPGGESTKDIPIIAPLGSVQDVDLLLDQQGTTTGEDLRLHFTPGRAPHCAFDGTWGAVYPNTARSFSGLAAPPGADVIVAAALKYVGRQYCWGGKGYTPCSGLSVTPPCADYPCFDCSGLTWFSYKENGWPIGQGTENQKKYQSVPPEQIQPGDLMLFSAINAQNSGARITHVGLYAGDLDGDGKGDMIHAANYPTGVIITKNVLGNPYYVSHLVVITRPPRGGGL